MSIYNPDFNSPTWKWLEEEIEQEIEKERDRLEGISSDKLQYHQGIIRAYKNILMKKPKGS